MHGYTGKFELEKDGTLSFFPEREIKMNDKEFKFNSDLSIDEFMEKYRMKGLDNMNYSSESGREIIVPKYAKGLLNGYTNSKYNFLPSDVKNVIINQNAVIVNLRDGCKGISKCSNNDEFDNFTGFCIAYYKAKNVQSFKLKEVLDSCVQSANEKGYRNAILKNE